MKKEHGSWTIDEIVKRAKDIEFPEFQREATIWKLEKKQRLIDSIVRDFDISSIYLYQKGKKFDCIDGQQRINAIWSYVGINSSDEDNKFHSKISNEIYEDSTELLEIDEKRYENLPQEWQRKIKNYAVNVVILKSIDEEEELNLQFIRLQLGAPLNAGEKLHAMTGDIRDWVFNTLSKLGFFSRIKIRARRYAQEQVAAQITLNAFSRKETGEFRRSRYIDLQDFFKEKDKLSKADEKVQKEITDNLKTIETTFGENCKYIDNRALAVSVYLFSSDLLSTGSIKDLKTFAEFYVKFVKTLKWQVPKGLGMDREYQDLLNFQTNITQAAGEKTAIQKRHDFWRDYFFEYKKSKMIIGDKEHRKKGDPDKARDAAQVKPKSKGAKTRV